MEVVCPYCECKALLVTGKHLYRNIEYLWKKKFWVCSECDAHVGCHSGTARPLGSLANRELRQARMKAHAVFDPIWRRGKMRRGQAYRWLEEKLGFGPVHIGESDLETCRKIVEVCNEQRT